MEIIAYYLAQFHPIAENNAYWGDGFTEWHNVAKARPLFPGHVQPNLPGKLGFYDLRCEEVLMEQMQLAKDFGVTTFCFWHYWFAGKRILHDPMDRMLQLPDNGIKFMLGWANESWSGIWHGASNSVFIEQTYNDQEVDNHAKLIADYMQTGRFLKVNDRYPFVIYKPRLIPDVKNYLIKFKQLVKKYSGEELYLIGNWGPGRTQIITKPNDFGLDAVVITPVAAYFESRLMNIAYAGAWRFARKLGIGPEIRGFTSLNDIQHRAIKEIDGIAHATIVTGWDNTPRSGRNGLVLVNYNSQTFTEHAANSISLEQKNAEQLLFLKSWNEWAEGNTIEPLFKESWSVGKTLSRLLKS